MLENGIVRGPTPDDPLAPIDKAGADFADTFPTSDPGLVVTRDNAVVDSHRFRVTKPTTDPAFVRLRIQEGIADHIRYVDGRAPTATVTTRDDVGPEAVDDVPIYETAVAAETAKAFGLRSARDPAGRRPGRPAARAHGPARPLAYRPDHRDLRGARSGLPVLVLDDPLPIHPVIRALSLEVQLLDARPARRPAVHRRWRMDASHGGQGLATRGTSSGRRSKRAHDRTSPGLITASAG